MTTSLNLSNRLALIAGHVAGMLDLVALPLWMGVLIGAYGLGPQQAGGMVTLFLVGVMLSSIATARLLVRLPGRAAAAVAAAGFAFSGLVLLACAHVQSPLALAVLHVAGGLGTGVGVSLAHGAMGRSSNPHRLFGHAFMAIGVFGLVFLMVVGWATQRFGSHWLFHLFAAAQLAAAALIALAFPRGVTAVPQAVARPAPPPIPRSAWFGMAGVVCMMMVQAMTFAFAERIGLQRGLSLDQIVHVLSAVGLVTVVGASLATHAQRRIDPRVVLAAGPVAQALLAATIVFARPNWSYVAALLLFVSTLVVTHTFVFGLLARLDLSGRATAATPAMTMAGSAIGPVLAGTVVKFSGFGALGVLALAVDMVALVCLWQLARGVATAPAPRGAAVQAP